MGVLRIVRKGQGLSEFIEPVTSEQIIQMMTDYMNRVNSISGVSDIGEDNVSLFIKRTDLVELMKSESDYVGLFGLERKEDNHMETTIILVPVDGSNNIIDFDGNAGVERWPENRKFSKKIKDLDNPEKQKAYFRYIGLDKSTDSKSTIGE